MDLDRLVRDTRRIAHEMPGNDAARNLIKLAEEVGELARTWTRQMPREAVIEEACDVMLTALVAVAFADASGEELADTLQTKLERALARIPPGGAAGGA